MSREHRCRNELMLDTGHWIPPDTRHDDEGSWVVSRRGCGCCATPAYLERSEMLEAIRRQRATLLRVLRDVLRTQRRFPKMSAHTDAEYRAMGLSAPRQELMLLWYERSPLMELYQVETSGCRCHCGGDAFLSPSEMVAAVRDRRRELLEALKDVAGDPPCSYVSLDSLDMS